MKPIQNSSSSTHWPETDGAGQYPVEALRADPATEMTATSSRTAWPPRQIVAQNS